MIVHNVKNGSTNKSFGLEVAKLAGVPKSVVDYAQKIVYQTESHQSSSNKKINLINELLANYTEEFTENTKLKSLVKKIRDICE